MTYEIHFASAQDFGGGLAPPTTLRVTPAKRLKLSRSTHSGFCAASKSVSGDGHTAALVNRFPFSGMASGMSVMVLTGWM
jgi:hypothetical protein